MSARENGTEGCDGSLSARSVCPPWGLARIACSSAWLRCMRRGLYVQPTSETQPSWPLRSVAASCRRRLRSLLLFLTNQESQEPNPDPSFSEKNLLLLRRTTSFTLYSCHSSLILQIESSSSRSVFPPAPQCSLPGGVCMSALPFSHVTALRLSFSPRLTHVNRNCK